MDSGRLYKLDKDRVELIPFSRFRQFVAENVFLIFLLLLLLFVIFWAYKDEKFYRAVLERDTKIEELTILNQTEEDYLTLSIKISEAFLEGKKNTPFNDSIVYDYIKSCGAWYPEIIMAQYKIESGGGTSDVAKKAKNFFGMRPVSGKRKEFTTQCHGQSYKGYAVYYNWKLSILDKILWEHFRFSGIKPNRDEYLKAHGNYASGDEYVKTINNISQKYAE